MNSKKQILVCFFLVLSLGVMCVFYMYREDSIFDTVKTNCRLEEFDETSRVTQITELNYDKLIGDKSKPPPVWLLLIYSPRCPYCRKMKPEWEDTAVYFQSQNGTSLENFFNVGKVDGTCEVALRRKFHVHGYPSIIMVDGEEVIKFPDTLASERKKDKFVNWALENSKSWKEQNHKQ